MAVNVAPDQVIPSWAEAAGVVSFDVADIPKLSTAEADGSTGDIRKVLYALSEVVRDWYTALPIADRPTKMTPTHTKRQDPNTSNDKETFSWEFTTASTDAEVVAE